MKSNNCLKYVTRYVYNVLRNNGPARHEVISGLKICWSDLSERERLAIIQSMLHHSSRGTPERFVNNLMIKLDEMGLATIRLRDRITNE